MMSGKLMKSPYGEGLSMSQVWCDVLNFLVGLSCIINGFSGGCYYDSRVFFFTGKSEQINNLKSVSLQIIFQDLPIVLSL